jgi:hypothetical protein
LDLAQRGRRVSDLLARPSSRANIREARLCGSKGALASNERRILTRFNRAIRLLDNSAIEDTHVAEGARLTKAAHATLIVKAHSIARAWQRLAESTGASALDANEWGHGICAIHSSGSPVDTVCVLTCQRVVECVFM